jgi:hypothetical protein
MPRFSGEMVDSEENGGKEFVRCRVRIPIRGRPFLRMQTFHPV